MLTRCVEPGCKTLVMGGRCVEHELPQMRAFVRGRPFTRSSLRSTPVAAPALAASTTFGQRALTGSRSRL